MGSRPHKTTTTRRREKSEERREKKEEKRDPKRGRQRSPNEAARGGPTLFSAIPPSGGTSGGFEGRGKRAEKREKREERSEKRETSTIKMRGSKDAIVRSQNDGMVPKRVEP